MPPPYGEPVQINFFCNASYATDLSNCCSHTGLNSAPIRWFSKRQNTIEGLAYCAEFVAFKIAGEVVQALCYKLHMMGVPLDGPAKGFVDNQGIGIAGTSSLVPIVKVTLLKCPSDIGCDTTKT